MNKYIKIILTAIAWGVAIYLIERKKYKKALFFLIKSEKTRKKKDAEILLLKAFLLISTGDKIYAEEVLKPTEEMILNSKILNKHEKIYLNNYRLILLFEIDSEVDMSGLDFSLDDDMVSEHLKNNHPYEKLE